MPVFDKVISLLAPHRCLGCNAEGTLLCAWCVPDAAIEIPSRCFRCKKLTRESETCKACRKSAPLRHVWIASQYEGIPKKLIHELKFEHSPAAAQPIAELLSEALPILPDGTILTFVPTASSRVRQRGYDHMRLIARYVGNRAKLPCRTMLERHGSTRQVGAKRAVRLRQLSGAFEATNRQAIQGARVLLVDDIVTTGATLAEAAKTLRRAGARQVDGLVFAQAPDR
jgi:ComF family protein